MEDLSTLAIGPQSDAEVIAAQHAAVLDANERRSRIRLAASNRAKGIREPQPGDRMTIQPARGIRPGRTRAGVYFAADTWTEIRVAGPDDEGFEAADGMFAGGLVSKGNVVSTYGAEMIYADDSLTIRSASATEGEAADERVKNAALEAENRRLRAELAAARARREAPPDPGDGTSSRLKAAAAARAKVGEDDFGGKVK